MSLSLNREPKRALVFDSGVGGLTVAEELAKYDVGLEISYAADTGFFPYGDKPDVTLQERLPAIATALVDAAAPDIFIIACNTASTLALSEVRAALSIPVVGTVPAVKPAAAVSKTGTIGLLATPGTLRRSYTRELIDAFASGSRVIQHGSVELVKLAEKATHGSDIALVDFAAAQAPLFTQPGGDEIDTVVLACTHFPLVRNQLIASAPRALTYIDSGSAIARQTLNQLGLIDTSDNGVRSTFASAFITSNPAEQSALITAFARYGFQDTRSLSLPGRQASVA